MLRKLKMTQIHANPNQPREYFNEEKMEELKTAIKTYGLIQAIEVSARTTRRAGTRSSPGSAASAPTRCSA